MNKGRARRPVRRMGTEIHEDRRTRRLRTRSEQERADIENDIKDEEDEDPDWEFDFYVKAWEDMIGGDIG